MLGFLGVNDVIVFLMTDCIDFQYIFIVLPLAVVVAFVLNVRARGEN